MSRSAPTSLSSSSSAGYAASPRPSWSSFQPRTTQWCSACSSASGKETTRTTRGTISSARSESASRSNGRSRSRPAPASSISPGRRTSVDVTRPPARRRRKPVRRDGFPARAAQLLALSSFAVAQPLFDLLGKNPEFFAVRGSSSREIVTFALALTFVLPAVLLGAEALGSAAHPQLGRVAHLSFVGGLAALIALQAVKRAGLTGSVAIAAAAVLAAVGVVAYARTRVVPAVLTVLAPAALFFDELSTVGLMDAQQQVDAKRFPNFADLARHSTWFRSARSDHPHSEQADPAILTGRFPQPDRLPIFAD